MKPETSMDDKLAALVHDLKGLCGIFGLVESAVPDDPDVKQVFEGGLARMREMIRSLEKR